MGRKGDSTMTAPTGISKADLDNLSFFLFNKNYPDTTSDLDVYFDWMKEHTCNILSVDEAAELLDHIRRLRNTPRDVLKHAITLAGYDACFPVMR